MINARVTNADDEYQRADDMTRRLLAADRALFTAWLLPMLGTLDGPLGDLARKINAGLILSEAEREMMRATLSFAQPCPLPRPAKG